MALSEARASRFPCGDVWCRHTDSGLPLLTRVTFSACRAHYPGGSVGCFSVLLARSRAGFLPQPHWPSRTQRTVGIHGIRFEACSSFTGVKACRFAHPPLVG